MQARRRSTIGVFALRSALCGFTAHAASIQTIFVIAMGNHNWTQPANQFTGNIQQIYQNSNAPFSHNIVGVMPATAAVPGALYVQSPNDLLNILPGRSIMVTFTAGWAPRR